MAAFIELIQVEPGVGLMSVNVEKIVLFRPSGNADGGTDVIVEDGNTSYDAEEGYRSYTVTYRVKENYQSVKATLMGLQRGK